MKLNLGSDIEGIPIMAGEYWNDTKIDMDTGERYMLTASGRWLDFFIPSSPDGYSSPLSSIKSLNRLLRHPTGKLFSLIGCLDRRVEQQFIIGRGVTFDSEVSGRLYCFANDVPGFYWNNWGHIALTIKRTM
jgi:hypothetical protein